MSAEKIAHWKQKLAQSRMQLRTLLMGLSPQQWQTPVYSEGNTWTISDIVAHLLDSERGMSIHVHLIRQGKETIPAEFDIDAWNAGVQKRVENREPQPLMQALAQVRARTLEEMDKLADEDWAKTGRHPARGVITIEQYYETIALHETMHAQDIRQALEE